MRGHGDFGLALRVDVAGTVHVDGDVADDGAGEGEGGDVVVAHGQAAGVPTHRQPGAGEGEAVGGEAGGPEGLGVGSTRPLLHLMTLGEVGPEHLHDR